MYNYFCQYNDSFIFLVLLALTVYTTDSRFLKNLFGCYCGTVYHKKLKLGFSMKSQ